MNRCIVMTLAVALAPGPLLAQEANTKAQARVLFEEGSAAFHAGDYERAITLFQRGYDLDPVGAFLLNIAQSYRLKRPPDCAAALKYYELYLVAEPRSPERPEITSHIASMRLCAAPAPAAAPPAPAPVPAPRSRAPLWLSASGAAVTLVGGGLYLAARLRYDALEPTCPCPDDVIDRWQTTTRVGYGLLAGGALLVSAGLVWWLSDEGTSAARASRWHVGPGGVGGRF